MTTDTWAERMESELAEGKAVRRGEYRKALAEEPPCEKVRTKNPEAKCDYDCSSCGDLL